MSYVVLAWMSSGIARAVLYGRGEQGLREAHAFAAERGMMVLEFQYPEGILEAAKWMLGGDSAKLPGGIWEHWVIWETGFPAESGPWGSRKLSGVTTEC